MAKTSGRPSDIQSLLTAAEKKIHDGTLGESLAAATREQLEAARKQARALRDKWRDLFTRQSIATKKKASRATDEANARSREKSDLFTDAIKRVETRLSELAHGVASAIDGVAKGMKAGRTGAARSAKKPARQAAHRATRATIRGELASAVAAINETARKLAAKAAPPKKAAKATAATAKPAAAKPPVSTTVPRGTKASQIPVVSKKARQAGKRRALAATGTGQPLTFDATKQRSAKARATMARMKIDGEGTRRKGFVAANTKRNQARRDQR